MKKPGSIWRKAPTTWLEDRTMYISVPFTWNLPAVEVNVRQVSMMWDRFVVGGPAVKLYPEYFDHLRGMSHFQIGDELPGVLQRVNPQATRTTTGCIRRCGFCGIGTRQIEGEFEELEDWPDLPIICDNNLLCCSQPHFDRVMDRLERWGWCDFNQGLDCRLLTDYHAERIGRVKGAVVRLALDSMVHADTWKCALSRLVRAGTAKRRINTYSLIGYEDGPEQAWARCEWINGHGIKVLPMWYHSLKALEWNAVTEEQQAAGWSKASRIKIMDWYYNRSGTRGP